VQAPRTMKFLWGILKGAWVVAASWLQACAKSKELVDEHPYEVRSDTVGIEGGVLRGRHRAENNLPGLFKGKRVFLAGPFVQKKQQASSPDRRDIFRCIELGDGHVLRTEPRDDGAPDLIVIVDPMLNGPQATAVFEKFGKKALQLNWLLDSISTYRLSCRKSKLFTLSLISR